MAHKTFISYKYDEASHVRDAIIAKLGKDSSYYEGETCDSPDWTDLKTNTIKEKLKEMIYPTSVTIVVVSPNMKKSKWIDWEIEYSLKETKRGRAASRTSGLVGVVMKSNGGYDWLIKRESKIDNCTPRFIDNTYLYDLIIDNRSNLKDVKYICAKCKTIDILAGSYISLIEEEYFLANMKLYIDNAYAKSESIDAYKIRKCR